ncbi:MAG: C39 family peptidase [Anaerolineae bacterium]|nr:C39 family peptidase [Anaerolineae bacterium]
MSRLRIVVVLALLVFAVSVMSVGAAPAPDTDIAAPAANGVTPRPAPAAYFMGQLKHSVQTLNNCGPASVVSAMSFYDIDVSQEEARKVLRPYAESRGMSQHVIPPYVAKFGLQAKVRLNGNDDLVKALVANDIPVIVLQYISETWRLGHFRVVQGYDDRAGVFYVNDSLLGPNIAISYRSFDSRWDYNWSYYVPVFRPDQAPLVAAILGPDWTDKGMYDRTVPSLEAKLAADPKDWRTWSRLIEALTGAERYQEALDNLDEYTAARGTSAMPGPGGPSNNGSPSSNSSLRIKLLNKLERYDEALAEVNAAIAKSRDGLYGSGSLWLQKAEALRGLGRYDEARAAYQRAIANDGPLSEAGQRLQTLPR